ncbi:hypothetical protein JCM8202v2_004699 [Rhodotorula sphaerocarpa]
MRAKASGCRGLTGLLMLAAAISVAATPLLEPRYDHSALPGGTPAPSDEPIQHVKSYTVLIAIHGAFGFLALQVLAPLAVIVASVGRSWPDSLWFRLHWRLQVYGTWPALRLGITLLGLLTLQMLLGYYAHARNRAVEAFAAQEDPKHVPEQKRRAANWWHIGLGIAVLTLGGLQVTWGFEEYDLRLGKEVSLWIQIIHFVVAGLLPAVVAAFILVRGFLRLRRGQTFAQAFFNSEASEPYQPPPRPYNNFSNYLHRDWATVLDPEKDEVGTAYARGRGADGRQRVVSYASGWSGPTTREEYEEEVQSSFGHGGLVGGSSEAGLGASLYDYPATSSVSPAELGESNEQRPRHPPTAEAPNPTTSAALAGGGPSHIAYMPPTSSEALYPPIAVPPPATKPLLPPTQSVPPPPAPVSTASAFSEDGRSGMSSWFSPRLSFLPFAGASPQSRSSSAESAPESAASPAPPTETVSLVQRPRSRVPFLVPSPPPVPARPQMGGDLASTNVSTPSQAESEQPNGSLARHVSSSAQIETFARPGPLAQADSGSETPPLEPVQELRLEVANPDPNPETADSDDEAAAASGIALDSESTRLMDELERELSVSTTRSGRTRTGDSQAADSGAVEAQAIGSLSVPDDDEAQASLAREPSGKWLSGGK